MAGELIELKLAMNKKSSPEKNELVELKDKLRISEDTVAQLRELFVTSQAALEKEKEELQTKLNEMENTYNTLQEKHRSKKAGLKARIDEIKAQPQEEQGDAFDKERFNQLELEVPKLKAKKSALKKQLKEAKVQSNEDQSYSADQVGLQMLKQKVVAEKRQKEEAILESSKLKCEIDEMSAEISQLADSLDMVPSDSSQVLKQLKEVVEDYKNLQKSHDQLTKRSSDESEASAREVEEMRGEISIQDKELNVVHTTNQSLIEQLKTTTASQSDLNEKCHALELDLMQAETDVQILQKEKQILVQKVATMESDMSNLINEKNSAKSSLTELRDMVEGIQMETNDQLSNYKIELYEERKLAESYLEQKQIMQEEFHLLEQKLEKIPELEKQISRLEQKQFHLQSTIDTMEENEKELHHTLKMKNSIIQQFKQDQSDSENGLDPKEKLEELITKISQLEVELENAQDCHTEREKALSEQIQNLTKENEDLTSKMEKQKVSIGELETR